MKHMSAGSGEKSSGPGLLLEVRQLEQNMMHFRLCSGPVTMSCTIPWHWEYGVHWEYSVSYNVDLSRSVHVIHNLTTVMYSLAQTKKKKPNLNKALIQSVYIHAELTSIHWSPTKPAMLNMLLCSHKHHSLCKQEGTTNICIVF